jgi:acylphosphatase
MPDGSVNIIAEGSLAALEDFARLVWADGEPEIRVDKLQVTQGEATGEFKGFWVQW